jgi:hypothetical protein
VINIAIACESWNESKTNWQINTVEAEATSEQARIAIKAQVKFWCW